jgi:hypothetical protein
MLAACGSDTPVEVDVGIPAASPGPVAANGWSGATVHDLVFACLGDSRPAVEDDTSQYPTNVVGTLFERIEALSPWPPLVLGTGDYVFASTGAASTATAQIDLFWQARNLYRGTFLPTLGNHECTGATSSNCGPGAVDGTTPAYAAFVERMLAPLGLSEASYVVRLSADDGTWNAKFVFVAANAWSDSQASWFNEILSETTTYTFVVRHEPASAVEAPGVGPSEAILAAHPYTLVLVGHSHTYAHSLDLPRQVVIGNGGAPLDSKDYGFGLFARRADGAIVVDMMNWQTGEPDPEFHFAVYGDGSEAAP